MSWAKQNLRPVDDEMHPFIDNEGGSWDTPQNAIAIKLLGFCGCGDPEAALAYVRSALRLIVGLHRDDPTPWDEKYRRYREHAHTLFHGDRGTELFMWYFLDDKGLTEHGTSVPGWLTPLGNDVLEDLESFELVALP
jgi:hypothetical protein